MNKKFMELMEESPIIAAVKDNSGLTRCLESESRIVFVLFGDILSIAGIVNTIKESGRIAIIHIDLISGLSSKEIAIDFIKNHTLADGIISTKQAMIKHARELGLFTVFRFFVIDSMAFDNIKKQSDSVKPDFIEILPGIIPKVIRKITGITSVPLIAGGLISDKEDVMAALSAGAISISSTNTEVWFM